MARKDSRSRASAGATHTGNAVFPAVFNVAAYSVLLTPLFVYSGAMYPHLTPKVLGFQLLVSVAAGLALLVRRSADRSPRAFLGPIPVALAASLLVALATSILFGTDRRLALWGFLDRQDGLVLHLHLLAWFGLLLWWFSRTGPTGDQPALDRYLRFSYWVAAAVAATTVFEWAAVLVGEPLGDIFVSMKTISRASGVFGNPVLLGPYLLFHWFYGFNCIRGMRGMRDPGSRALAITLAVLGQSVILGAILAGKTRGVVFALAGTLGVVALLAALSRRARLSLRLTAASLLVLGALGTGILWSVRESEFVQRNDLLNRLTHFSMTANISTQMRVLSWQSALEGFKDRPVVGWGHDNVYFALNRHYNPEHVKYSTDFSQYEVTWYDKSHNAFIDLLVERGILGFAAFLVLVAFLVRGLWKMEDRFLAWCLGGAFLANAVSNAVSFDNFGSLFGFHLFLVPVALYGRDGLRAVRQEAPAANPTRRHAPARRSTLLRLGLPAVGVAVIGGGIYLNSSIGSAVTGYASALAQFRVDPNRGWPTYLASFETFSPYAPRERLKCGYAAAQAILQGKMDRAWLNDAVALARSAAEAHPSDAWIQLMLNDLFNGLGLYIDKSYFAQAEAAGRRALELSPKRQEAMFNLGRTFLLTNQAARAVELNRTMVKEFPGLPVGHWLLGLSLMADNRKDEARTEIRGALKRGYKFQDPREEEAIRPLFDPAELNALLGR
jgi:O-antigen ligase/tetratricopeptide (TPR) repeat protein